MNELDTSSASAPNRSSPAEQQAQPLLSSIMSSGRPLMLPWPAPSLMSLASTLTAATSFTTTPTLTPSVFSSRCLSSVVLPVPRKPLSSVTGIGLLAAGGLALALAGVGAEKAPAGVSSSPKKSVARISCSESRVW